jgi:hypothetical protein
MAIYPGVFAPNKTQRLANKFKQYQKDRIKIIKLSVSNSSVHCSQASTVGGKQAAYLIRLTIQTSAYIN